MASEVKRSLCPSLTVFEEVFVPELIFRLFETLLLLFLLKLRVRTLLSLVLELDHAGLLFQRALLVLHAVGFPLVGKSDCLGRLFEGLQEVLSQRVQLEGASSLLQIHRLVKSGLEGAEMERFHCNLRALLY